MSALPPKADIKRGSAHVRLVPKADSCSAATGAYWFQRGLGVVIIGGAFRKSSLADDCVVVPAGAVIAVLLNPTNASIEFYTRDVQAAARTLGQQIDILYAAGSKDDFETAFATVVKRREAALVVGADPLFNDRRVSAKPTQRVQCESEAIRGRRIRRPFSNFQLPLAPPSGRFPS